VSDRLRDFEPGRDEAAVAALWGRCFGEAKGGQTPAWLFREGPAGPAPRVVAEVDGRVVAHAGMMPVRFHVDGRTVRGGYSVGAMTDPDQQGRGWFVRTATHLYERLEREGFGFVAGFSNASSHHLHVTRLERTPVRPFPWCVRPLRPLAGARALWRGWSGVPDPRPRGAAPRSVTAGALRVEPVSPDDPRLDALWERVREEVAVGAVRDAAYARWRYGARPRAGYRALLALRGEAPLAWIVGRILPMRGLLGGFLMDLSVVPGEHEAGSVLLQAFESWVREEGGHVASALLPGRGTARSVLRAGGYRRVPERLHPQVVRLSVRGFGDLAASSLLADPSAWCLSWGDVDVV